MILLILKGVAFVIENVERVERVGVSGDKSGSAKEFGMLRHAIVFGKGARVGDDLCRGFALRDSTSVAALEEVVQYCLTWRGFSTMLRAVD